MNAPSAPVQSPLLPMIDGAAIRRDLTAIAHAHEGDATKMRNAAMRLLKEIQTEARAGAERRLMQGAGGLATAHMISGIQDAIIAALYDFTVRHVYYAANPTESERLAVVAVGGYGRGTLAPGSDIDLLFLFPWKQTPWGESVVEFMLYMLWDLGLKVGHATRSLDECLRLARSDMTIRTSVLEARYLWGDRQVFEALKQRFEREFQSGTGNDFVEAKLAERDERHGRAGESRYLVEPNVKDGKGGLRDLQTLFWIGKYLYRVEDPSDLADKGVFTREEFQTFRHAEEFLWRVRCHLHFHTRRAEERISFDVQRDMAVRMGYGAAGERGNRAIEHFMRDYFLVAKDVGDLTRIFCAALEDQHKKSWPVLGRLIPSFGRKRVAPGFFIEGGRVQLEDAGVFARDPVNLLRLFQIADEKGVHIHPDALKLATRSLNLIDDRLLANEEANRLFLSVLSSPRDPERVLRWMNECGVLGKFVPAFGRIVALMQFNMYHHYTVDEHLLRAIGNLSLIERGELKDQHPLAASIIHKIQSRPVIYLAMLLHDIAKGTERDHSEEGEEIARELGPRLGLSPAETETVAWLVRNHLVMSDVAQKRDLSDPKTIDDFVHVVQTPERLRLLLILTVADIRAVGPGVWNGWKGQLLRELYYAAEQRMVGGSAAVNLSARADGARAQLGASLADWPEAERARALNRHYPPYWLTLTPEMHERHAKFIRAAEQNGESLALEASADPFRAVTECAIYTADHPGLFYRLAGGFAVAGASIVDAKAFTTNDGMALDVFWIQDALGGPFELARLARLKEVLIRTLKGEIVPRTLMDARRVKSREDAFRVEPSVIVDNEASDLCTVIEVDGRDRPGLLHDLTRAIYVSGLSIHSAQIATYGERAVDVFYVKDLYGHKITHQSRIKAVEKNLQDALGGSGVKPERPQRPNPDLGSNEA